LGLNFVLETILVVFLVVLWGWCKAAQGLLHDWVQVIHRVRLSWLVVGETHINTTKENFIQATKKNLLRLLLFCGRVSGMKKDDQYYLQVLAHARKELGSYKAVAKAMGAPSGPAVQAWLVNGVAYKWRPVLDKKFGAAFRKTLNDLVA
jgi:hypothetical protein